MKQVTYTLYTFDELSDKAKQKAIDDYDYIPDYDWWEHIYEDAELIGMKITGFDTSTSRLHEVAEMDFLPGIGLDDVARAIVEHFGEKDIKKAAKEFLAKERAETVRIKLLNDGEYSPEDLLGPMGEPPQWIEDFEIKVRAYFGRLLANAYNYIGSDEWRRAELEAQDHLEYEEDGTRH